MNFTKFFSMAALVASTLVVALPMTVTEAAASGVCIEVAMNGEQLDTPICDFESIATTRGGPGPVVIAPPPVVTPPVVTPPVTPEPSEPNCEVVPGTPIYGDVLVGYEQGDPIKEKVAKYKTIRTPFGTIEIFVGYEWVTVGYEQGDPIYENQIIDYNDPTEVCTEVVVE